jgi:AcrR family transcriptional regulator
MKTARVYTMGSRADGVAETRERIVRSALKLFVDHWFEDVTLAAIAEAAGVSHQTVLNHFESKEGVGRAAAEMASRETEGRRAKAVPGDSRSAVATLVGEYERTGDANVGWAMSADRLGSLAPLLDHARAAHQRWLEDIFASQLPSTPAARRRLVNALHAATDVYTWKLLRRDLRLSRAETERTMIELVSGLVDRDSREDQ